MIKFVHLSDLHFGSRFVSHLGDLILKDIEELNPDAVVVSGDFTLRARHYEYQEARVFLDKIPKPTLTIPGNHDQPLFAPVERLVDPYRRYRKYICPTIDATLGVDGLYFVGLSDCHPILPGGFWWRQQRLWIRQQLENAPQGAVKVIVSHHQFLWGGKWRPAGFWYPTASLAWLGQLGVELVLNGHTHVPVVERTASGVIVARAGTATSDRIRHGWSNTYNVVVLDDSQITISIRQYDQSCDTFLHVKEFTFPRHSTE